MTEENKVILIPIDDIIPNRFQPRLKFNEKELQGLAESISEHGIVSPIIVRQIGDKYEIIAGERRYKAASLVGLQSVPCIVRKLDDVESAEIAVIENLQRSNLTPIEEAKSYEKLLNKGMTQEQLAKRLGVSQPTIANKVRLLNLTPEVQEALLHNKISERHARSLLSINNPELQNNLLNTIITNRLTVRQTDNEVNALLGKNSSAAGTEDIFNVNIDEIKENADDLFKKEEKIDFDSLLKKDVKVDIVNKEPKKMEIPENVVIPNMDQIKTPDIINIPENSVKEKPINPFDMINPFQQVIPEENDEFDKKLDSPDLSSFDNYLKTSSTIKVESNDDNTSTSSTTSVKKISSVINATRNMRAELENQGIDVDTEEFDFDDMYEIVIKVRKN